MVVALLGDAAQAMTPNLGQGACQAIEDAVTLGACLDTTTDTIAALNGYDRLRRPWTQAIVRHSARLGAVGQWSWPIAAFIRDLAARLAPDSVVLRSVAPVLDWVPPGTTGSAPTGNVTS
jgi:2-polyprenyl-6-methoxyphenol hydroxylase-like FAD-dependent oxidoreductase